MDIYWKALGALLIAVVLGMILDRDMSLLLSLAVCAMGTAVVIQYLQPVLSTLGQMEQLARFQGNNYQILIKILGISVVSEIAGMICTEAGAGSMGKLLKILTKVVILWIALPVFQAVLTLLQQILGEL